MKQLIQLLMSTLVCVAFGISLTSHAEPLKREDALVESVINIQKLRQIAEQNKESLTKEQQLVLDDYLRAVGQAALKDSKRVKLLKEAQTCATVDWGCGSCNGGARTNYSCGNIDRSETVDYSVCRPCR